MEVGPGQALRQIALSSGRRRNFQPRNVALGMKPLENLQTSSLIFPAAVSLLGHG
jgi:hypothetical protein